MAAAAAAAAARLAAERGRAEASEAARAEADAVWSEALAQTEADLEEQAERDGQRMLHAARTAGEVGGMMPMPFCHMLCLPTPQLYPHFPSNPRPPTPLLPAASASHRPPTSILMYCWCRSGPHASQTELNPWIHSPSKPNARVDARPRSTSTHSIPSPPLRPRSPRLILMLMPCYSVLPLRPTCSSRPSLTC